jgi:hypothetical protein
MLPGLDKNAGLGADVGVRMLGGGLSGITAASMTYPLDLVRTRLAAQVSCCHQLCSIFTEASVKISTQRSKCPNNFPCGEDYNSNFQ